jgi:RNA polymerase sigma-70 factor (ECF subfamily)
VDDGDLSRLIGSAQSGDEESFRGVYRAIHPGLLRCLRALVGDDAEDVASEAWLRIARDLGGFTGTDGFRAWALTIARHCAMDHLRRTRRRPAIPTPSELLPEVTGPGDAGEQAVESMSTDAAIALISALPRDQAEAVLLRVVVGLDATAAARVLGKRPGAVRTAAYRGLRRLAAHLDNLAVDPDLPLSLSEAGRAPRRAD